MSRKPNTTLQKPKKPNGIDKFLQVYKLLRQGAHYEEQLSRRLTRKSWTERRIVPIRSVVQAFVLGVMETVSFPEKAKESSMPIPDTIEEVVSLIVEKLYERYENRVAVHISPAGLLSDMEEWLMSNPTFLSWDDQGVDLEVALSNCAERIEGAINDYSTIEIPDDREWEKQKYVLISFIPQSLATAIIAALPSPDANSTFKLPRGFSTLIRWISFNLFKKKDACDIVKDSLNNISTEVEKWCNDSSDYLEWTTEIIGEPQVVFEIVKIWLDLELGKIEGIARLAKHMVSKAK